MPSALQLVLGVCVLAVLGGAAVLGRRLLRTWLAYRGTRVVVCPESREMVAVEVDAAHAATGSVRAGRPELRLESCTRWPERQTCGQECLGQVESTPEACLLGNILGDWYQGQACVFCGRGFTALHWHDQRPALLAPDGSILEWSDFRPERVIDVLASHRPVCAQCRVSEGFRRAHPELVTDRPPRLGPPPSMA